MNDLKYAHAFGVLESAVHRALREIKDLHAPGVAYWVLHNALKDLEFNHGIELQWPDDVKEINHG